MNAHKNARLTVPGRELLLGVGELDKRKPVGAEFSRRWSFARDMQRQGSWLQLQTFQIDIETASEAASTVHQAPEFCHYACRA